MIVNDNDARRPESAAPRSASGWTSLHSWIFLAVVAVGLLLIGIQNRYHYLSPLGLGKAYRIDKLFGGIQEFDPARGWIKANLQASALPPTMPMTPPPQALGSQAVPMNMPGTLPPPGPAGQPSVVQPPVQEKEETKSPVSVEDPDAGKEPDRKASADTPPAPPSPSPSEKTAAAPPAPELSEEQKLTAFKKEFPDFGKDEFQLANDDLYPDWKKKVKPNGTWQEFLGVYEDFIQWWTDAGSPAKSGVVLWKEFLTSSTAD
ncbi:MAG: hypothetical protein V1792_13465 [Pseudomonadota bacterium]